MSLNNEEPGHAAHQEDVIAFLEGTGGDVHILGNQALLHGSQCDAERVEQVTFQQHADFLLTASRDAHFRNTG